jgi:phenylpropionate dioxygenase-like ring-hydroxylating dioxygenase large terminal subunit
MLSTNATEAPAISKNMISGKYLRDAWYVAAWSDDLEEGGLLPRTILGEPVVLFRKADQSVVALSDRCPHRFAPLHMGKIVNGDRVQCPYHGLEFDSTGACVRNPHIPHNIPPRARVRQYPTIEKHKAVWVWMAEGEASHSAVPDFSVLDNVPGLHETKRDRITINAHYELIVDNLLDLSQVPFLHEGILGNQDTIQAEITVEQEENGIIVGRVAKNVPPPGLFATFLAAPTERVDQFSIIRWMPPSNMRLFTRGNFARKAARGRNRLSCDPLAYARDRPHHPLFLHGRCASTCRRRAMSLTPTSSRTFRKCDVMRSRNKMRR